MRKRSNRTPFELEAARRSPAGSLELMGADGSAPPAAPAQLLLKKYRELNAKYQALVRRSEGRVQERSSAVTLALAAMSSGSTALALVTGRRIATHNTHWATLEKRSGLVSPWRLESVEDPAARPYYSLQQLALAEAQELLRKGAERARVRLFSQRDTGRFLEVRLERLRQRQGGSAVMVMAHDVTERVRTEQELDRTRQAMFEQERMRAVGELASGIAHDLNNALHAMNMRLVRLRGSGVLDGEQGPNVDALIRMVGDTAARISRLQELARQRQDVPHEAVNLKHLLDEALAVARPELEDRSQLSPNRITIEAEVPASLPPVVGAGAELRHVFLNLLLNARDAMPQGGQIRVEVRPSGDWVVVAVKDQGQGIRPEHLSRIFDPFFTTKGKRGTGLGLSIAYGVMRRLGGSIAAGNRPEGGAVITLNFPVARQPQSAQPAPALPAPATGQRILVIDDDPDNLEATRWVLEDLGQEAECAASGSEALRRFERGERFDLVLCDIGMPGMNGWETVERLQGIAPGTRTIMLSGWAQEIALDDERRQLVRTVLPKPLAIDEMKKVLAEPHDSTS